MSFPELSKRTVAAVELVHTIDPDACRRHARRFDAMTMCRHYERVYEQVVGESAGNLVADPA